MIRNLISRRSPSAVASATAGSCTAPTPTPVKTSQTCYHRNQQYSIVGLTNAAGTLVERYTYSAYGTLGIYAANGTVRSSSTYANRYTYTGREWDADVRLYHFRARWYDPATGGFISRDPLGYVDGMSLYRGYFGVLHSDPGGTTTQDIDVIPVKGPDHASSKIGVGKCGTEKKAGTKFAQSWNFRVPKNHRGGWLVQKVTVTCRHSTECDEGTVSIITTCTYPHPEATFSYCRCKYGPMHEFTYYEAWRVPSGKVIPQNPPGMPKTPYDDTAEGIPTPNAGCAEYNQVGELRFYEDGAMCGQTLSLDKDPAWSQLPGFRFGAHTGCGTTAGRLYAFDGSDGPPLFWYGNPIATGWREFGFIYQCCCKNKKFNFGFGWASPTHLKPGERPAGSDVVDANQVP